MKICLLTHTFPRYDSDSAAPFMDGLARGMVASGNSVVVLTPFSERFSWNKSELPYKLVTYKYIFPSFLHKIGYSETLTNDKKLKLTSLILSPFLYLFGIIALFKLVKKEKIDIINAHWILPNGVVGAIVSILTNIPLVSTLPGSDVYMAKKNFLFRFLAKFAARFSKIVTSNSPQLLKDLEKITDENILVKSEAIIYGVDPSKFKVNLSRSKMMRKNLNITERQKIVLGVGRLVEKKGFKFLIKAAPAVLSKDPNVIFVIVGEGDQKQYLKSLSQKLNVYNNFRFIGEVDYKNLIYYYNLADVFILPSVRDTSGNLDDQSVSVIEAMACAKPVITTDFSGYRLVVKNEVNGFLVKEKSVTGISNAITGILGSYQKIRAMGRMSRKLVEQNFSWKDVGNSYSDLFERVISKNKSYFKSIVQMNDIERRKAVAKQILGVLKNEIGDLKPLTCLDVACSSGVITNELAQEFKEVVGIDSDIEAIKFAREKYKRKNLKILEMDVEEIAFGSNSFDVIVCNQVYNFVDKPNKLMKEIYRVLKPRGICFFSARNKLALVEPQYNIPFASWFSKILPFGRNYMSVFGLKNLVYKFTVRDYTLEILRNPTRFSFKKLEKYSLITNILPLELFYFLIPNYIWVLTK